MYISPSCTNIVRLCDIEYIVYLDYTQTVTARNVPVL